MGIPVGTNKYVQEEAVRTIEGHDEQLKRLIMVAEVVGTETVSCQRRIGRQCARVCLRYAANARNVHLLRSIPRRLGEEAAGLHDDALCGGIRFRFRQIGSMKT